MAYGINFNNNSGARVLDGKHLLPQKIGTYYMYNYGYTETGFGSETTGPHPGYKLRKFNFTSNGAAGGRPHIAYWEFPDYRANDIWMNGNPADGCQLLIANGVAESSMSSPKCHIFALDYVSQSNAGQGLRAWNPDTGQLIYDSGNQHLSIYELFLISVNTNLGKNYPGGSIMSANSPHGYFPWDTNGIDPGYRGPAFTLPFTEGYVQYGDRFGNQYEWNYDLFYRVYGQTFETRCMRTYFGFLSNDSGSGEYTYSPNIPAANLSVSNIYGDRYS